MGGGGEGGQAGGCKRAEAIDHTERMIISTDIDLGNLGKLVKESQQTPAVANSKESLPTTSPKTILHLLVNPTPR